MWNSRKLKKLEREMDKCKSYAQWRDAALQHDELSGQKRWREIDQSSQYDYGQIRLRLDRIRNLRARHDYHGLLFTLNEGIHGNIGGMGNSALYRHARFGTKRLIEQYIEEIDDTLRLLAELDDSIIGAQEKLEFFYRANICFGRSALMLSGGGVLGFYHLGVVKALLEQGLLPQVISGSSAGAIIAGAVGTHTEKELEKFFDPAELHFEAEKEAGAFSRLFFGANPQIDAGDLEQLIARQVPDMTFEEAYEKTGRQISISIAPAEPHQRSRLLNAITSPNVFVRSAIMASCAVPGVFPAVTLMAKNAHGEAQPYQPTRKWIDGSIADDLPFKRLSRLYSTNHYIVSMVNPVATPFLHREEDRSPLARSLGALGVGVGREVLSFYRDVVQKRGDNWPRFNMLMNGIHALVDQEYSGDINIVPSFRWYNPTKILSHLSEKELMELLEGGEHSTFSHVEAVRLCTRISRTMEEILYRFEQGDLRPDAAKVHRPRASRRRPAPARGAANADSRKAVGTSANRGVNAGAGQVVDGGTRRKTSAGREKSSNKGSNKAKTKVKAKNSGSPAQAA